MVRVGGPTPGGYFSVCFLPGSAVVAMAPNRLGETWVERMVAKPEWGTKRICPSCGTRYYDLLREPVICPKCSTPYDPEAFLKSRRARPAAPVLCGGVGDPVTGPKSSPPYDPEAFLKSRRAPPAAPVEKELEPVGSDE